MKINFSNLGSIKETELDLRPLTVIIGPNNSNKTYIAYCVYGLWFRFATSYTKNLFNKLDAMNEFKMTSNKTASIKIDEIANIFIEEQNTKIELFKENLAKFFQDSSGKLFSKTNFTTILTKKDIRQALDLVIKDVLDDSSKAWIKISIEDENVIISVDGIGSNSDKNKHMIRNTLFFELMRQVFPIPFVLPAERNAFIITYKILADRRFNLLKKNQRELIDISPNDIQQHINIMEQSSIRYPEPIEDFLEFLTNAEFNKNVKLNQASKNEFQKLADKIEYYIINKNKIFYEPTVLEGKEIKVRVNKHLTIDLHNASSSIKQLTPLLLYLRYRAKKNDLLVIDEPEMNLHPESQAKLLEIFGILVNLGINVLITTHSPYFMAHLNNLINKNTDTKLLKKQAGSLYLKDSRAFLPLEQVSAYEMKDNKLVSLKDEEENVISWNTLSDISFDIQRRYFELDEIEEKYGKK